MDKLKLDAYRQMLEKLLDRLQGDATAALEQTQAPIGGGELSNAPLHLGDRGSEEYSQDLNAALLEHERNHIDEAVAALRRIKEGTFGSCNACGRTIPDERLEAIPWTPYCAGCSVANQGPGINVNEGRPSSIENSLAGDTTDEELADPETEGNHLEGDVHAAGTAGGGTEVGGLAGSNIGHGDPVEQELEAASGGGGVDAKQSQARAKEVPQSGRGGGAVGGTPAGKRTHGTQ